jgi:hypothetical protein
MVAERTKKTPQKLTFHSIQLKFSFTITFYPALIIYFHRLDIYMCMQERGRPGKPGSASLLKNV